MPLSTAVNQTCDIYRLDNAPPAAPDVSAVPCTLINDWRGGQEAGDRKVNSLTWTNVLLIDGGTDIRDGYTGACGFSAQDTLFIPDLHGAGYAVIFVERNGDGRKRVFLDRRVAAWATSGVDCSTATPIMPGQTLTFALAPFAEQWYCYTPAGPETHNYTLTITMGILNYWGMFGPSCPLLNTTSSGTADTGDTPLTESIFCDVPNSQFIRLANQVGTLTTGTLVFT